jgi:hypothetical protein
MKFVRVIVGGIAALIAAIALLPVLVIGLPFFYVAGLTKAFCRRFEPHCVPWQRIIEYDPVIGWKPKANLDLHCSFARGTFHLKTDAYGWRGPTNARGADMIVVGDSFAFGYGVDDKDAFFSLNHSNLRIKAIGSPGYNMVQEVLWMRQWSSILRDKVVVWFICISNDLYDNMHPNLYTYRTPFVCQRNATGKWEIVFEHLSRAAWPCRDEQDFRGDEKFAAVFGVSYLSERVYGACSFLIREGREVCQSAGARLAIVAIPWTIQMSNDEWKCRLQKCADPASVDRFLPDRKLREICLELGIPFIAAREHMNLDHHIPGDGHWNRIGHQRVADILKKLYAEVSSEESAPVAVQYTRRVAQWPTLAKPS